MELMSEIKSFFKNPDLRGKLNFAKECAFDDVDSGMAPARSWGNPISIFLLAFAIMCRSGEAQSLDKGASAPDPQATNLLIGVSTFQVRPLVKVEDSLYQGWEVIHPRGRSMVEVPNVESMVNGNGFADDLGTGGQPREQLITGFHGNHYASSNRRGLGTFTGVLRSSTFIIRGDVIDFLIGGGKNPKLTSLSLFVERNRIFELVRSAAADDNLSLERKRWDVSQYKGFQAYLEIRDDASVEPWLHTDVLDPTRRFGFIAVDDIRQLDRNENRVSEAEDNQHNFDFEQLKAPEHPVTVVPVSGNHDDANRSALDFVVGNAGRLRWTMQRTTLNPSIDKLDVTWTYQGRDLSGVTLGLATELPVKTKGCDFYVVPGLLYNGNPIGMASHYYGEDFPEDAITIPGGYSAEDDERVFGEWVAPQKNETDAKVSLRLETTAKGNLEAIYLMPPSLQLSAASFDYSGQLTVHDGFRVSKSFFLYHGKKDVLPNMSNAKQGYGQVLRAAWQITYPSSPTNPPHSLNDDYRIRMHSLLDPYTLMQEVKRGGRTYRIWYIARWELPDDFDFKAHPFVPMQYFHHSAGFDGYTGFSWSGMLGRASYAALGNYIVTRNANSLRVGVDTLDLFADHGVSPLGIIYQAFYGSSGGVQNPMDQHPHQCPECPEHEFGTYGQLGVLDMGPLGEELYWYIRSYQLLKSQRIADKRNWIRIAQTSLDKLMSLYPNGDIPGRIDGTTGKAADRPIPLIDWPGDGQIMYRRPSEGGADGFTNLIWAYTSFFSYSHDPKYVHYAELLGDQLLSIMMKGGALAGAEEDIFNIDKRSSHAALAAFNDLYTATGEEKWRSAAILGGNSFASWQYSYNVNFQGLENTPAGHFDYRTVGGTPVDVGVTSNNLVFEQGATEFVRLWNMTGDPVWFERARALLHQGVESTLTEEKREWLNAHFQGPADPKIMPFNPLGHFDLHSFGGGTEDVLTAWPEYKGMWTTKDHPFISMYMFAEGLDWGEIRKEFGSITYSFRWKKGGALDTLDQVQIDRQGNSLLLKAQNMIGTAQVYRLRLLEYPGKAVRIDGHTYTRRQIDQGISLSFGAHEQRKIHVQLQ
jgi:hypothetical protein